MYNEVLKDTWNQLVKNRTTLLNGILVPLLILVCIELFFPMIDPKNISFEVYLSGIVALVIYIYIAITVHRILILGTSSVPKWGSLKLSSREGYYFLKMILFAFLIAIPMGLVIALGAILRVDETMISFVIISAIVASILVSRMSLVFPAVAVDDKVSFTDSWKLTKQYKLLTFITIVFFPLILTFLVGSIYSLVIEFLMQVISTHLSILMAPLNVFINVLTIACLSSTYKFIKKENKGFFEPVEDVKLAREIETFKDNDTIKKLIDVNHNVTFESLKQDLISQYEPLGFINTVIDRTNSWMIKSPELGRAYVILSLKENNYVVETFNTEEANLITLTDNK